MKLEHSNYQLDYEYSGGKGPCVVFCPGFNSNKQGNKALALEAFCKEHNQAYIRFDYSGHGESGGDFNDGNISQWLSDTLAMIDQVADGKVVLVGSSMGGWISLLAALQRPETVTALLLIACAADMTKYYPKRLAGLALQHDSLGRGYYAVPNEYDEQQPYAIYQHLIEDGEKHTILDQEIQLDIPVRLIHGMQDDVVPWQRSQQVIERLSSNDASLHLLKSSDHRLSLDSDIKTIISTLKGLLQQ